MMATIKLMLISRLSLALGISLALAAAIFAVAWQYRDVRLIGDPIEQSRDVTFAVGADGTAPQSLHAPFAFIAVDEATFDALGRPDHTPHDRIAALLLQVAAAHPVAIVLDLDITWTAPASEDKALDDALRQLGEHGVPVLLLREVRAGPSDRAPYALPLSRFDALVAKYPSLEWVVASAPRNGDDTVRAVLPFVRVCRGGQPLYLPGVGVAAAQAYSAAATHSKPATVIFPAADWSCAPGAARPSGKVRLRGPIATGGAPLTALAPVAPIRFTLKWPGDSAVSAQTLTDLRGKTRPLYAVLSARPFMGSASNGSLASWTQGAIAVIGASHADARDIYATPLGRMPGSFIIVNLIRALLDFGPDSGVEWQGALLSMLLLSAITAVATVWLERYLSTWLELFLPFAITGIWWLVLTLTTGGSGYFALAFTQFIVSLVVRLVPPVRDKRGEAP